MTSYFWSTVGWVLFWFVPSLGLLTILYFILTLPLRRQERARFFLDLIETGLKRGRPIEETIVSIARTKDRSAGIDLHWMAAHLDAGWKFGAALEKAGEFLPPSVAGMLRVGSESGELAKVLPACRRLLPSGGSPAQTAVSYLILISLVMLPVVPIFYVFMMVYIVPKLQTMAVDFEIVIPELNLLMLGIHLAKVQIACSLLFYLAIICAFGGYRFRKWLEAGFVFSIFDRLELLLPWRQKRLFRDFAAMLALLVDAGLPETKAVAMAADSVSNQVYAKRARRAIARLESGQTLPQAIEEMAPARELTWRLSGALRGPGRYFEAFAGWLEAIEAKAYQQEQSTAQIVTSGFLLLNGLMTGLLVIATFGLFVAGVNQALTW